jgi:hypothetical protein
LTTAPDRVRVTVDHPLDPFSLGLSDLFVERVEADGSTTLLIGDGTVWVFPELDETGRIVELSLAGGLAPGRYRVSLTWFAVWFGTDGAYLPPLFENQVLTEFTIDAAGPRRADAIDLGLLGPDVRDVSGALDFVARPGDVRLYRFDLAPGRGWRVGAEISTASQGSPLHATLALFHQDGTPIAASSIGRAGSPNEPYLFEGLRPGRYYVGVSGASDNPTLEGGYDLINELAGSAPSSSPGGPFTLQLVADRVTNPPTVVRFRVNHADELDPSPTGFSLQFSRAIRTHKQDSNLTRGLASGLELVDAQGQVWPIVASGYDEARAEVQYLFEERLPVGIYTIRYPNAEGGLFDLAGLRPVAQGMSPNVLATFRVLPRVLEFDQAGVIDLGAPRPAEAIAGVHRTIHVPAGQSREFRLINLYSDATLLEAIANLPGVRVELRDHTTGESVFDFELFADEWGREFRHLPPGEYRLVLMNRGEEGATISFNWSAPAFGWEILLGAGLGQGPALGLRLIAPTGVVTPPPGNSGTETWQPISAGGLAGSYGPVMGPASFESAAGEISDPRPIGGPTVSAPLDQPGSSLNEFAAVIPLGAGSPVTLGGPLGQTGSAAQSAGGASSAIGLGTGHLIAPFLGPGNPISLAGHLDLAPDVTGNDHVPEPTPVPEDLVEVAPEAELTIAARNTTEGVNVASMGWDEALRQLGAWIPRLWPGTRPEPEIASLVMDPETLKPPTDVLRPGAEREVETAGFGTPFDAAVILLGYVQGRRIWGQIRHRRVFGRSSPRGAQRSGKNGDSLPPK